jgi:hypothetical protein
VEEVTGETMDRGWVRIDGFSLTPSMGYQRHESKPQAFSSEHNRVAKIIIKKKKKNQKRSAPLE